MKRVVFNSQRTILSAVALLFFSFVRPDKEFRIFQFPQHQIPRIDGDFSDWSVVPETYTIGLNELKNTRFGEGKNPDSKDFDLKVKVGWVKGLNRLYFYIDAYDDFWDFKDPVLRQDIFELVVDGDHSGGLFIDEKNWDFKNRTKEQPFFTGNGTKAQNYHIFTPALNKDWAMAWGNFPWIKEFTYANAAYHYNFKQGESGRLQMEFYITPYDFASFDGPEHSIESQLKENELIGLSWSMLDFDGKSCESFLNLSYDFRMISDADYLCAFRLMPPEDGLKNRIEANWKFNIESNDKWIIRFFDHSVGEINKWHWDFGDGKTSEEENPVHQYNRAGAWTVILTVEGPAGKSVRSKVWDIVTP
jgi:PKD repeat protein